MMMMMMMMLMTTTMTMMLVTTTRFVPFFTSMSVELCVQVLDAHQYFRYLI